MILQCDQKVSVHLMIVL